ncbi:MAG: sensor histidine kinase [Ancrocorticia sp.]
MTATRYWWDAIFVAVVVSIFLVVFNFGDDGARPWAFTSLALIAILWLPIGRRALQPAQAGPEDDRGQARSGAAFVAIMVVGVFVLSYNVPMASFFLTFACPYAWASTKHDPKITGAIWSNVLLCAAIFLGQWGAGYFVTGALSSLISLLFSVSMGLWITRIAHDSEERGRLEAKLEATNQELIEAHRQAGAARERERFAHEIHDTLTQTLTAVVMLTERARGESAPGDAALPTIASAERTARQALAETRSLIAEGRGTDLGGTRFSQRIMDLCARVGEETGIHVETQVGGDLESLTRADQVVLLRCLQELLSNVRKHARAGNVIVEVDETHLAVTDDGAGFPDSVDAATERGYGLAGIASRLALAHGTLTITTGDEGTRVSITLAGPSTGNPLDAQDAQERTNS